MRAFGTFGYEVGHRCDAEESGAGTCGAPCLAVVCVKDDVIVAKNKSRTGLQVFLVVLGLVAFTAGAATVVLGVDSIVGAEAVSGTVDSEMRFYAVWYAAAGAVLLWSVPRAEIVGGVIRAIALLFFVGGCSRALSWAMNGQPHTVAQVLMVVELALPLVIVPWHTSVVRTASKLR